MAHVRLAHLALQHLPTARLRRRQARPLRAVRPSRATELWYRAKLRGIVEHLRAAGAEVAAGLHPRWPTVGDEAAPGLDRLLARMAERFGNIRGVADRLAALAARKSLGDVDERLGRAIHDSVGIDIRPILTGSGRIASEMARAARANADLIVSLPAQHIDTIRASVTSAWQSGERWESLAARIAEIGDITDNRARLIARDQTSKMNAGFNRVRQTSLGIDSYEWSGARDARERDSHVRMEGAICRWDSPPEVDGERVHPGEAINCRCVPLPRVDLDELEAGAAAVMPEEAAA